MSNTDYEDDVFIVRINNNNQLSDHMVAAFSHDEAKRDPTIHGKGSLVFIRSMTGKTPVPKPISGRTADVYSMAEIKLRRRRA